MLGAIAGDIIGSPYEGRPTKNEEFPLFSRDSTFTDDTVLSVALADSIIYNISFGERLKHYTRLYPYAGYGMSFLNWVKTDSQFPYNSFGNGSAMRVSPVGWAYSNLDDVLKKAKESAEITHSHPEGIKGAQAVAAALFLARTGHSKEDIKTYIQTQFGYNVNRDYKEIKKVYYFDITCQGSVPEAMIAFFVSTNFEDAVRKAVALGGDSDTQACIAGCIAEAFYSGVPEKIKKKVFTYLDPQLTGIVKKFIKKYVE